MMRKVLLGWVGKWKKYVLGKEGGVEFRMMSE